MIVKLLNFYRNPFTISLAVIQ